MITEVVSFDGHAFAGSYEVDYVSGTRPRLPPAKVATLQRIGAWPVIVALQRNPHTHALLINIVNLDNVDTLRTQLMRWFDPEDETPKLLVCENHAGVEMYGYALCQELRMYSTPRYQQVFVATLVAHGDVRWRSTASASDEWPITATAQTRAIVNAGEDEAYPVYKIKPTTGKIGGYDWRRWVPVKWRSENAGSRYPVVAVMDTATPIGATKMQPDGDDLRVLSDGLEIRRWLNDINTATTDIWFNLDFTRAPSLVLETAIAGAGDIASIEFTDEVEVSLLPEAGIIYIGTEAFVYTARSLIDAAVTGITRAAKGTAAGAHNVDDVCYWIQHDIYVLYGNATATDPAVGAYDLYQPAFDITDETLSNNTQWHYLVFGDEFFYRTAAWSTARASLGVGDPGGTYTGLEGTLVSPWTTIGTCRASTAGAFCYYWQLYNPCGIVDVAWAAGRVRAVDKTKFHLSLRYWVRGAGWWSNQLLWQGSVAPLAANNTWYDWNQAAGVDWNPADWIMLSNYGSSYLSDFEAGTVTVYLQAAEVPVVAVGAEQGNYELGCTLTNEETGEAITLEFVMDLDTELEVDTDARTVTWLADDSGQFQAKALSTVRRHWLRLLPGSNTLRFDDVGTGEVTVTTEWEARYY